MTGEDPNTLPAPPDHQLLARSGLFDADWYRNTYSACDAGDELAEFCRAGWQEGRAPNPYFDAAWYVARYPDSVSTGLHPLTHYALYGDASGCLPGPFFDTGWYRETHEVRPPASALAHYLRRRWSGAVAPVPDFDPLRYLRLHPHIARRGADPYLHWRAHAGEPAPDDAAIIAASGLFDATFYLVCNPDVRDARLDPLEHYCAYGWREGRNPNLYFDTAWYLGAAGQNPPDAKNPLVHYYLHGEPSGLAPSARFDAAWYAAYYALPGWRSALAHYLEVRRTQRFSPNPAFDVIEYVSLFGHEIGPNRDAFAHFLRRGAR